MKSLVRLNDKGNTVCLPCCLPWRLHDGKETKTVCPRRTRWSCCMEVRNNTPCKNAGKHELRPSTAWGRGRRKGADEADLSHPLLFLFCFQVNGAKGSQPPPLGSLHRWNLLNQSSERLQHRHAGQTETVVWLFTHLTLELQRNQKIRKCSLPQAGPRRHIPARLGIESCRPVSAQLFTHPSSRVGKWSPLPSATSPTSSNTFHLHPTTQPHCLALTLEYANWCPQPRTFVSSLEKVFPWLVAPELIYKPQSPLVNSAHNQRHRQSETIVFQSYTVPFEGPMGKSPFAL